MAGLAHAGVIDVDVFFQWNVFYDTFLFDRRNKKVLEMFRRTIASGLDPIGLGFEIVCYTNCAKKSTKNGNNHRPTESRRKWEIADI